MLFASNFTLTGHQPQRGGESGLWRVLKPAEVATAESSGSGPGMPDATGGTQIGTIPQGTIVEMDSNGNAIAATPAAINAVMPKLYFVTSWGDDDFDTAFAGQIFGVHGCSCLTDKFDAGTYTPGQPLVVSNAVAGNVMPKGAFGDHAQIVAFVGPDGVKNGVLDMLMPQGVQAV